MHDKRMSFSKCALNPETCKNVPPQATCLGRSQWDPLHRWGPWLGLRVFRWLPVPMGWIRDPEFCHGSLCLCEFGGFLFVFWVFLAGDSF